MAERRVWQPKKITRKHTNTPNHEAALAAFGNEQFQLVLAAGVLAHDIQRKRLIADREDPSRVYEHTVVVEALEEIGRGLHGRELLDRVTHTKMVWK